MTRSVWSSNGGMLGAMLRRMLRFPIGGEDRPAIGLVGLAAVVALIVLGFGVSLCWRGIILSDEGYLLLQALDMRDGKILYRDMDAFVTPGIWFLLAGVFQVFEPSVLTSRYLALAGYLAMVGVSYRIVARLASRGFGLIAVASLLVCSVWAFPAWTFSFYSPFAVLFALAAIERLLAWRGSSRGRDLLLAGILLGLSISFKQNYGVFALFGAVAGLMAMRIEAREPWARALRSASSDSLKLAAGLCLVGIPLLAYFAYHGAIPHLVDSLIVQPFVFAGQHDIAYPAFWKLFDPSFMDYKIERWTYGAYLLYHGRFPLGWWRMEAVADWLHVVLYWIPPLVLATGFAISLRPRLPAVRVDAGLFTLVAISALVFLGVFPRADFNHLINVYQPIVVTSVVVLHYWLARLPAPRRLSARMLCRVGVVVLTLYTLIAGSWFFDLHRLMTAEVTSRRGGVLVEPLEAALLGVQIDRIKAATQPGEAVLTVPDLSMLNFLAERPMPSRYYNLYEHHIRHDEGAEVVAASERAGVRLVIARMNDFFSDRNGLRKYAPRLSNYLTTHFDISYVMKDGYLFLERRGAPLRKRAGESVLADCEEIGAYLSGRVVGKHLLYDSLYLHPGKSGPRQITEARCRVVVPARGELRMRIGVTQPEAVERGTWVKAEVRVIRDGQSELVFERIFDVMPLARGQWGRRPYPEYRVDLSHLEGQEVTLLFRTTREGEVRLKYFDTGGFSMVWEDPRIEQRSED